MLIITLPRACAARVTVLVSVSVCLSVCLSIFVLEPQATRQLMSGIDNKKRNKGSINNMADFAKSTAFKS